MPTDSEFVDAMNSRFGQKHRVMNLTAILSIRPELATKDYVYSVLGTHPTALLYLSFEDARSKDLVARIMPDCAEIMTSKNLRAALLRNQQSLVAAMVVLTTDTVALAVRRIEGILDPAAICAICREQLIKIDEFTTDVRAGTRMLPCGHSLHTGCLQTLLETAEKQYEVDGQEGAVAACPECRSAFGALKSCEVIFPW